MRGFDIPAFYRSPLISKVKAIRKAADPRKRDFAPSILNFGTVRIQLARHFGFCFGVENAVEIAYRAIAENPGKRIYLLSQMIHNPEVNDDLQSRGVQFLQGTGGEELIPISELGPDDVVIIPAFGTTLELSEKLDVAGVEVSNYDTTCPFVEKVWKRAEKLGGESFTTVIHGKPDHEETRATFSHAAASGHALVIKDMEEAVVLTEFMRGDRPWSAFGAAFPNRTTQGFVPERHLQRVGVVNQTTMLATETQAISDLVKSAVPAEDNFANTRDTLCYATNDNQQATLGALAVGGADMALVVGGYNSSNTTHLVELCEERLPTFFIRNELEMASDGTVNHFDYRSGLMQSSEDPWPDAPEPGLAPTLLVTSGASCPDASVDRVVQSILTRYPGARNVDDVLTEFEQTMAR
jgi:4-hydroxy-3-methylbut-2-en-1-yl diphosphate reductase